MYMYIIYIYIHIQQKKQDIVLVVHWRFYDCPFIARSRIFHCPSSWLGDTARRFHQWSLTSIEHCRDSPENTEDFID